MITGRDLLQDVERIFGEVWDTSEGRVIPDPGDLAMTRNEARYLPRATVLYADLTGSTALVDSMFWQQSAEIYKTYLHCAAKLIMDEGGKITSYDGDRVMGVWIGDAQCTSAVRCALKINCAVKYIINPAYSAQYSWWPYEVSHVVGIDTSPLHAARTGVRGENDIVWVGRAANHAAKLTNIKMTHRTWITKAVYDFINPATKYSAGVDMWELHSWSQQNNQPVYGSIYHWSF